jgi:hypothetical protein
MAYKQRINAMKGLSTQDKLALTAELDTLYADLTDMRTKYAALLAKMDADAFGDTNYAATVPFATRTFTQT